MQAISKPGKKKLNRRRKQPLDVFFSPKTVAVIGATENPGTVGRTVLWNLVTSPFGGTVYPVNPKRPSVLGVKAYPSVSDIPESVDLAVIIAPPASIPGLIKECGENGVQGAIVISAGFKEIAPEGAELERQLLVEAQKANIRIIGPNCLGVMSPLSGMNATFATTVARPGSVGFISQSGALCTAVLDWSLKAMVGFSAFISVGSMVDVGWGGPIYYLGNDPKTKSIVIYMEAIGHAGSFLSAAREVALTKPIIIIKPGRSAAAAKAAASHPGSLTGSDEVLEAAFRRSGVLRVGSIADLFYMAEVLSKQPTPKGPRLTIVTNAGGPGVLATDALIMGGGELSELTPATMEAYNAVLPATWSHNNPVDIIGDASPERYAKALEIAAKDPNSDGMLVILTPQAMTDPTRNAETLKPLAKQEGKPLLASWMGGVDVAAGEEILNRANIPTFPYPDTAARVFNYMWQYADNLKALYETPAMPAPRRKARQENQQVFLCELRAFARKLFSFTASERWPTKSKRNTKEVVSRSSRKHFKPHKPRAGSPTSAREPARARSAAGNRCTGTCTRGTHPPPPHPRDTNRRPVIIAFAAAALSPPGNERSGDGTRPSSARSHRTPPTPPPARPSRAVRDPVHSGHEPRRTSRDWPSRQ